MPVVRFGDTLSFLQRARPFLMRHEAENGFFLGLEGTTISRRVQLGSESYLAALDEGGEIGACAFRTPPYQLLITRGAGVDAVVDDVRSKYAALPGVTGPEPDVVEFARRWSSRTGVAVREAMKLRLLEARHGAAGGSRPAGRLRAGEEADLPIVAPWMTAFRTEALARVQAWRPEPDPTDAHAIAQRRVREGSLFVWDAGGPVSMAGWASRTARGARIDLVYTPPEQRTRGYGSACVAALTGRLLGEGLAFCCLYADLSNPATAHLYQKIGYHAVSDAADLQFASTAGGDAR